MRRARVRMGPATRSGAGDQRRSAGDRRRPARGLPGVMPLGQLIEIQRSRLLAGAAGAIEEYGYAQTTVAQITSRARVSRRTFYELFENREGCLAALIEHVVGLLEQELARAGLDGLPWRERVRGGLSVILAFFDREPVLARVCVVQALHGGPAVLGRREEILARLACAIDQGRGKSSRTGDCTPLTAEGLVGAASGILYARLLRRERKPLADLQGELMGMIVLPYQGPAAARREQKASPHRPLAFATRRALPRAQADHDPLQGVPMRLTYRTARVLVCIADRPGVSNREVAEHAGVSDAGQTSKLLRRLEGLGLTENTGDGHMKGEPNAWKLTSLGREVSQHLRKSAFERSEAA